MRPVTSYSLAVSPRSNQRAILTRENHPLAEVDGLKLEAQFELRDGGALIWLTENSPYDEGLHVYLLRRDGLIEDALEAGAVFGLGSPGILRISETGQNWAEFEFFTNDVVYRLEIAKQPGFRLRLAAGWRYKKLLGRHRLTVHEAKKEINNAR